MADEQVVIRGLCWRIIDMEGENRVIHRDELFMAACLEDVQSLLLDRIAEIVYPYFSHPDDTEPEAYMNSQEIETAGLKLVDGRVLKPEHALKPGEFVLQDGKDGRPRVIAQEMAVMAGPPENTSQKSGKPKKSPK